MQGCGAYWTIIVPPKTQAEEAAEAYLFVLPYGRSQFWASRPIRFRRWHLFFAVFCVQVISGSMYAIASALIQPLDLLFHGSATANEVVHALYVASTAMGITAAVSGPALERRGPRWGMAWGTVGMGVGCALLQIAVHVASEAVLYLGALVAGIGFGFLMLCSTATAQKWCPDIRGVITGISCFGWSIGSDVFSAFFRHIVPTPFSGGISYVFWAYAATAVPVLFLSSLVLRTPPPSFHVQGKTMHSLPVEKAPCPIKIQDEYLNVGMTLVNYDIVRRSSNTTTTHHLEGTDRRYFEQVKALTLLQCILSTDFLLLYVAYGANATAGLIMSEMSMMLDRKSLLQVWYLDISDDEARMFQLMSFVINAMSRLLYPMLSDVLIRLLYANPAAARKTCLWLLVLVHAVTLGIGLNNDSFLTDGDVLTHVNHVIRAVSGGSASMIICLLTDMYGVYNMGTMYGLMISSWSIGMVIVGETFAGEQSVFYDQLRVLWGVAIAGCILMLFVRTNSKDRFFRGYQLTICNKIWIQWPLPSTATSASHDNDMVLLSPDNSPIFLWTSDAEMSQHRDRTTTPSLSV
ncbi:hypothetical protein SPRG_08185 [Saprolegnia parasitica CBS 223.65]|uniref:Major facilitator superfamily (MFS) profile domain-containing protein n=1 Tax=Saprolegnia parasitica (strain CBS 223.65) TaxID=695850 RepID=A0A067CHU2_SAPPC|nr:hypothetical protein SPRG_08185 [Saprolegnia parasitica CBS 223.65]KDO26382.1 hypothetical protein SPRG_08185 [Saprolegnia parasitica CBS 223.65]|eukprot:XP_012202820.1 hypothetical protein SPRG_08185 [Saprolegnia parasitica CBS 223.65]